MSSVHNLIGSHLKLLLTQQQTADWDIWKPFGIENDLFIPSISGNFQSLNKIFTKAQVKHDDWSLQKYYKQKSRFWKYERQFAFTGATLGSSATESMTFKCQIKVCSKTNDAICSITNIAGQTNTCPARTYFDSGRKRRSKDDQSKIIELSKDGFQEK